VDDSTEALFQPSTQKVHHSNLRFLRLGAGELLAQCSSLEVMIVTAAMLPVQIIPKPNDLRQLI